MKKNQRTFIHFLLLSLCIFAWLVRCSEYKNPLPSRAHTEEWSNPQSDNFHGSKVLLSGYESCKSCHGQAFDGGESNRSCYGSGCHDNFPHPKEWMVISSDMFHGNIIRGDGWSMESCKDCHGEDYQGGSFVVSCITCHKQGPEGCGVCHGNAEHSNPPEDLNKNRSKSALGVGAHEEHVEKFECSRCHYVPEGFDDPKHIDGSPPAEVEERWSWDRDTATCATSCHGSALVWNNF